MTRSRDFDTALFVVGAIAAAQVMLGFSLPLLALEMSGAGTGLALIKGAGFIPNILFAIFIGVINDRLRKALAFRRYALGLTVATVLLALAVLAERVSIPGLILFMVVFNALAYATSNAQMSLIRLTVEPDSLSDATALTAMVHATITTVGPAVAGGALMLTGHGGLIAGCAVLLMLTTALAFRLDPDETLPAPIAFGPALHEGWRVLIANRELVHMTVVIVLTNAAAGAFETALILKLKFGGASDLALGLILAAAGVGAVVGSRFAPRLRRRFGRRTVFFWPIWALAGLYLIIILDLPLWAIGILSFLEGATALLFAIGVWSYRQETTEAVHMGRVAGLTGAIFKIGMPPVIILSGALADAGALASVLLIAAAINAASGLYLAYSAGWGWPRNG